MGYRTYIGSLPKEEHDKIKGMGLRSSSPIWERNGATARTSADT